MNGFNPFLLADAFWRIHSRRILKTVWQKEQFLPLPQSFHRYSMFSILLPKCFQSRLLHICCMWDSLNLHYHHLAPSWTGGKYRCYRLSLAPYWFQHRGLTHLPPINQLSNVLCSKSKTNTYVFACRYLFFSLFVELCQT